MALDEATRAFVEQAAASGTPPLHELEPVEARALLAGRLRHLYGDPPEMLHVEDLAIDAYDGSTFAARLLVPQVAEPRGVVVYYHGGGWVVGVLDDYDHLARHIAERTGSSVLLVDYRLAPEHRYPTAAEDAWSALRWASANIATRAGGDLPLVVAGDSAGGTLAAIAAQRATAEAAPRITLQVLVYPVTDCDVNRPSYLDPENQLVLRRDTMIWFWDHYLPDVERRRHPTASPLRADDLSGLPPAAVLTAEHDVLRDEGEAYAERLREAGVRVRSRRFAGQMHGFFTMVNVLPGHAEGLDYVVRAIDDEVGARERAAVEGGGGRT